LSDGIITAPLRTSVSMVFFVVCLLGGLVYQVANFENCNHWQQADKQEEENKEQPE
jgi:hypothetical protein